MAAELLRRVVFVKDPTALPGNVSHQAAVESLAAANNLVVLMSHGNPYLFPTGWIVPHNVKQIPYDLSLPGIVAGVLQVRELLREYDITMSSRHLDNDDALPMLLAGACLTVGSGTEVAFVNKPGQFTQAKQDNTPDVYDPHTTDWDLT